MNKAHDEMVVLTGKLQGPATDVGRLSEQLMLASVDFDKVEKMALQKIPTVEASLAALRKERGGKEVEMAHGLTEVAESGQQLLEVRLLYSEFVAASGENDQVAEKLEEAFGGLLKG